MLKLSIRIDVYDVHHQLFLYIFDIIFQLFVQNNIYIAYNKGRVIYIDKPCSSWTAHYIMVITYLLAEKVF